ncbi:glyoxalase [Macrococcoides canis]|uniref:glyoxalase n=1 Tax=Macrococcoides canis TaxID=1855823 RepID=UPI0020B66C5C|nr:glyoxalase [Macrococcus canis]UTG99814.1 glyoxalase [Macrococcus canis]WBF53197.1 glyoxalase [Macrococcus canis]
MYIKGLDHVQVAAPPNSEENTKKFYVEYLGLKEIIKPEPLRSRGGVWFEVGNQQLHVGIEHDFTPARKAHPAFEVYDLSEIKDGLLKNNIEVIEDNNLEGAERIFCHDLYGNRIELLKWIN